ncbi:RmlC-like cupin [Venturia nashicola]|uniref:RmlC-like cupin n=1 Tax=Venturia nashicola TaxID=86259 RepID=A0A4Z1NFP0_9PEZI|nr:RmlC-like cupin [Venturia nashicola]TLD18275.1 RmlC-like cupin [Venturia nashicola]
MLYNLLVASAAMVGFANAAPSGNPPSPKSSIWVTEVPTYVRPYAIPHLLAGGCVVGQQIYRFPVTGPSSDNAFSLIQTNAPGSTELGVLPHIHELHYETFFNVRGRFQLWTKKDGVENTRVLLPGDFGAVPQEATHTFQVLDPDTEMMGVIQPGGFEALFYALSTGNYSSSTFSPYDPTSNLTGSPSASVISQLQSFDVYAQLDYSPRTDTVNGTAPSNTTWHTGPNSLASDATTPYFVAKDYGPKYLYTGPGGYAVIQPVLTGTQTGGNFTISQISIQPTPSNGTAEEQSFQEHAAFEVLEGQLKLELEGETIGLLTGDVIFIPGGTSYRFWSDVANTKVYHVSAGVEGLDAKLIDGGQTWPYPIWPTS